MLRTTLMILFVGPMMAFTCGGAMAQIVASEIRDSDTVLTLPEGYTIEHVHIPDDIMLEVGGMDTYDDGSLVIVTRGGEVWHFHPQEHEWKRLALGLHVPLGVRIDRETGDLFVAQMTELTRLSDTTGDGLLNRFNTITADWGLTRDYHEYAFGPVIDSQGDFYVSLNLAAGGPGAVKGSVMRRGIEDRGWVVRISPDGQMERFASGFRSPAGIGINSNDEIFVTDNEGDWLPTSYLMHVQQDHFYGHPASLADHPDFIDRSLNNIPDEEYHALRTPPAVYFPHLAMAQSPGEPLFDETGGAFGPFEGQIFVGDQTFSKLMRISLEKVQGQYQGTVFNFARALDSGVLRQAFSPQGDTLWIGQTDRGWNSLGPMLYSLQKITYDGTTVPFEIRHVAIQSDGFELEFTRPADPDTAADPSNYDITHWTYHYRAGYGSPRVDSQSPDVQHVELSEDGLYARLILGSEHMHTDRVYEIDLADAIVGADGHRLANSEAYYTVNHLPEE